MNVVIQLRRLLVVFSDVMNTLLSHGLSLSQTDKENPEVPEVFGEILSFADSLRSMQGTLHDAWLLHVHSNHVVTIISRLSHMIPLAADKYLNFGYKICKVSVSTLSLCIRSDEAILWKRVHFAPLTSHDRRLTFDHFVFSTDDKANCGTEDRFGNLYRFTKECCQQLDHRKGFPDKCPFMTISNSQSVSVFQSADFRTIINDQVNVTSSCREEDDEIGLERVSTCDLTAVTNGQTVLMSHEGDFQDVLDSEGVPPKLPLHLRWWGYLMYVLVPVVSVLILVCVYKYGRRFEARFLCCSCCWCRGDQVTLRMSIQPGGRPPESLPLAPVCQPPVSSQSVLESYKPAKETTSPTAPPNFPMLTQSQMQMQNRGYTGLAQLS